MKLLLRRDAFAIIMAVVLWLIGFSLRPDYWWHLDTTFVLLLNYTEVALLAVGMTLLAGYCVLGWRYWFSIPFRGIVIATALYVAALAVNAT